MSWSARAPAPSALTSAGYCVYDGKLWLFGGFDGDWQDTQAVYAYDPATDAWQTMTPLPGSLAPMCRFASLGSLIYGVNDYAGEFFSYDPSDGTYTVLASPPGGATWGLDMVALGGLIYYGMSRTQPGAYDPVTDTWTTLAPESFALPNHSTVTPLDGLLYVRSRTQFKRYDPGTDAWEDLTPLPDEANWATLVTHEGQVLSIGGILGFFEMVDRVWRYNPSSDAWALHTLLPFPRSEGAAGVIGSDLIIVAGVDGEYVVRDDTYSFDGLAAPTTLHCTYHAFSDVLRGRFTNFPATASLVCTYSLPALASATMSGRYQTGPTARAHLTGRYNTLQAPPLPRQATIKGTVSLE